MNQADEMAKLVSEWRRLYRRQLKVASQLRSFSLEAKEASFGSHFPQLRDHSNFHSTDHAFRGAFIDAGYQSEFKAAKGRFLVANEDQTHYADSFPEAEWDELGQAIYCAEAHRANHPTIGLAYFVYDDQGRLIYSAENRPPIRWGENL